MYSILENTHKVKKIEHVMTLTHRLYKVWYNRPTFSLAGLFCNLTLYYWTLPQLQFYAFIFTTIL